MTRLPDDLMADVHVIRQDYARALSVYEAEPTVETLHALSEVTARRARAMRMIHEEDGATLREISAMFRTSKTATRAALEGKA